MTNVECRKCRQHAVGLDEAPLPGAVGEAVLAHSCRDCWDNWCAEQVKVINELSLSPAKPEHYSQLVEKLKQYLVLP